mmetsp:Transcript_43315/g.67854  ORF Transcript_43315/g.67854 Transcript_43315/m.67854 type:complete len:144 (+) Transcript_43315:120-551(+)
MADRLASIHGTEMDRSLAAKTPKAAQLKSQMRSKHRSRAQWAREQSVEEVSSREAKLAAQEASVLCGVEHALNLSQSSTQRRAAQSSITGLAGYRAQQSSITELAGYRAQSTGWLGACLGSSRNSSQECCDVWRIAQDACAVG